MDIALIIISVYDVAPFSISQNSLPLERPFGIECSIYILIEYASITQIGIGTVKEETKTVNAIGSGQLTDS